jgi:TolB-like protein
VLQFDNLSPDSADAYLADGLTEEVISRLGKLRRLQIKRASRVAVGRVRDSVPDYLVSVGRAMGVRYLVEGNVRSAGGRIRVVVRLVTAADGFRVWGEEYSAASTDLLALETDLASKVAAGVAGEMSASERASLGAPPTQNAQAYEHFLKGDYYVSLRTERGDIRAVSEYQEALRLDPAFNRARARMAYAYGMCSNYGYDCFGLGKDSLLARGFAVADSALRQDSTTSDAWLALAFLRLEKDPRTAGRCSPGNRKRRPARSTERGGPSCSRIRAEASRRGLVRGASLSARFGDRAGAPDHAFAIRATRILPTPFSGVAGFDRQCSGGIAAAVG